MERSQSGPRQPDGDKSDAAMSADEPDSATTVQSSSGTREERRADTDGSVSDPSRDTAGTASPVPDVTTQSALLALVAQPIATTEAPVLTQTTSDKPTQIPVESVMSSVMEDGTSVPVTAADSSTSAPVDSREGAATPAISTTTVQSDVSKQSAVETDGQQVAPAGQDTTLSRQTQATSEEHGQLQPENSASLSSRGDRPPASVNGNANTDSAVLPDDLRSAVREARAVATAITAEPIQHPEEHTPVAMPQPVQAQEIQGPKEEAAPRQPVVAPMAWQESASQEAEHGMEWSGRDHREQSSAGQTMAQSITSEAPAPEAPAPSTVMANGVDHRAFSSAPSAKHPVETQPAVPTPPVQPTDWMPGSSVGQTKSMMLELSQTDLGSVHVRVAVNQDTVHTHFSSERSDMGQYLMNGQDRLQSALNASGLDLGRFQVDINRQSAGQSFQQPASQGDSQGHRSHGEGQQSGSGREEAARDTTPRRGMLNLVA